MHTDFAQRFYLDSFIGHLTKARLKNRRAALVPQGEVITKISRGRSTRLR
jgi:hypothetical protein